MFIYTLYYLTYRCNTLINPNILGSRMPWLQKKQPEATPGNSLPRRFGFAAVPWLDLMQSSKRSSLRCHQTWLAGNPLEIGGEHIPIFSMYRMFTYIWDIYGVNVAKYSIHGAYGIWMNKM